MSEKPSLHEQLLSQTTRSQSLKKWLTWAVVFHVILLVVGFIGLPRWRERPVDLSQAVSVDLVAPRSEFSQAPNRTNSKKPLNPQVKPKETPQTPPKPKETPPAPVKSDAAKKDEVEKPVIEKPKEPVEEPKKDAIKPAEKKDPEKKKPEPKKKPKDDNKGKEEKQEEFNSILKNLLADDKAQPDGNPVDAPVDESVKNPGSAPVTSETMSISDMDALKYQLAKCWNVPSGAMDAENLIVDIRVQVNPDRTVKEAVIVDQSRYMSDSFFAAAADSARRALFNQACTPLDLPPEKYDVWKTLLVRFNPKDMFGG